VDYTSSVFYRGCVLDRVQPSLIHGNGYLRPRGPAGQGAANYQGMDANLPLDTRWRREKLHLGCGVGQKGDWAKKFTVARPQFGCKDC